MSVWAVVDKHRVVSVWTTEEAAQAARKPGQYVEQAGLMPTIAAVTDQVTRAQIVRQACSRFSGRVPVDGASGRGASPAPLRG